VKMLLAMDKAMAPPRELKNMATALPVGISLDERTTCTAMKGS
jgi:hypothetical protein